MIGLSDSSLVVLVLTLTPRTTTPNSTSLQHWTPNSSDICMEFASRASQFPTHISATFSKHLCLSNLLPQQLSLLCLLKQDCCFVTINADKNLGPCITKKTTYVHHVLDDHLLNLHNYLQLSSSDAITHPESIHQEAYHQPTQARNCHFPPTQSQ